ncbi:metal-dependent hydrolase [Aneurinibacillus terranovensis]|uniref:metal-dependent hydrolase n=1 Tax=Aneurinibacillus terranovensis TaxID=278991 RepID=UPI000686C34B|nr:metal-dependent hydrolase [Aneurinibacillus terranovensis]
MLGVTHMIAGAMAGYLVSPDWIGIVIGGVAGLLPDIDQPRTKIGKWLRPVSYLVHRKFQHRTFTHSLLFTAAMYVILKSYSPGIARIVAVAMASHIIGDMVTGRVMLLWPYRQWIGIRIPRGMYGLMDKGIRLVLIAAAIWYGWERLLHRI